MKNNFKKLLYYVPAVMLAFAMVLVLLPSLKVNAAGRLKCDSEKELWINRAVVIPVTLNERQKGEKITVSVNRPSYVKVSKGKWKGDVCNIKLTPKKSGTATVTVSFGTEKIRLKLHLSQRKLLSATEVYRRTESAMVTLETKDSAGNVYIGSGFFISRNLILTNQHVLDCAKELSVTDYYGNTYPVQEIVGYSVEEDLLLISVKASKNSANSALILSSELPKTGETIYSCGSPFGIEATFSEGIVSRAGRESNGKQYIQNTIPTSTGCGGGPVLNCYGEVVGIITMTVKSGQNLNLAVPITELEKAEKCETWKPVKLSDFFLTTSDEKKESNKIYLSDRFVQLTDRSRAEKETGIDYLVEYRDMEEMDPVELYKKSYDSVASIVCISSQQDTVANGTCFFISEDTVVTNYHILEYACNRTTSEADYNRILVWDNYGQLYKAVNAAFDNVNDVAVIRLDSEPYDFIEMPDETEHIADDEGEGGIKKHGYLQPDYDYIPFVGEKVYAIGNPLNYSMTFSSGIVSTSLRRVIYTDCIQVTVPTSHGSSGGVLLNGYGRVIGITSMSRDDGENLNWSVMIKYAKPLLEKLS